MATTSRKFTVGSLELVCLTDGGLSLPPDVMFPSVPKGELEANGVLDENGLIPVGFNSLVVRSQGKLILIDTGLGDKPSNPFGGAGGELYENFRANGLNPDDVDVVINTHGHPDHIGWNTRHVDGKIVPTFPKAKYYMTKTEWDWYKVQENVEGLDKSWWPATIESLHVLEDTGHMVLAEGEQEITSEVRMIPSPGHTVGHASVIVSSGGQTAMFLGDIMHHPAQFNHPEWVNGFDALPQLSRDNREKLFKQAYQQRALVLQVHGAWPGIAGKLLDKDGETVYTAE